ncbi:threonine aldolase family protein [Nitratireductor basaltis]|uniref:L-threonine aldolase n=1 Tax=Nitratireductor basaltis TaxID=472175 RepID=A0A084U835_9HYPH|nr:low specificity L-threonine aldolase [Nitratireductor basaltis]KFB09121.1 L-threonine aldolase [Nitratireductor basaltis]
MNFASDNWAGAHPAISEALAQHSTGHASAYGTSELDRQVEQKFSELFEREVAVFFVSTGTAANALSMALTMKPGGVCFAHEAAHMIADEGGAPEYLSGGGRLRGVAGGLGRMDPAALEAAIGDYPAQFIHAGQPASVSITQASEIGTVYDLEQIEMIGGIAKKHGLPLHMDGARFANALVSLDTTPAEMTWKRGVDILSFGGTKNGCWCAEAIVVMDPDKAREMPFIRKRSAQLFSKSRFVAAQFAGHFNDDLWLKTARHANAMGKRLADSLASAGTARLAWTPQANEIFLIIAKQKAETALQAGARFYPWPVPRGVSCGEDEGLYRFVTSFATSKEDVDAVVNLLA